MWGWHADYPDPENFLFLLYGPNSKAKFDGENVSNYDNPEYNRLFDQMQNMDNSPRTTPDYPSDEVNSPTRCALGIRLPSCRLWTLSRMVEKRESRIPQDTILLNINVLTVHCALNDRQAGISRYCGPSGVSIGFLIVGTIPSGGDDLAERERR